MAYSAKIPAKHLLLAVIIRAYVDVNGPGVNAAEDSFADQGSRLTAPGLWSLLRQAREGNNVMM